MKFLTIICFFILSATLLSQNPEHWDTYTRNRAQYRVLSPLKGKMVTHFVGLQVDVAFLDNKNQGYTLLKAGFRKDAKTGKTKCFEVVFDKKNDNLDNTKIPVELIAFDIRNPKKRMATYQAIFSNLALNQEAKTVRCQIPIDEKIASYMAFVLVAQPPFVPLPYNEYKKYDETNLFNGSWEDDEKEEIFIYAPIAGYNDYDGMLGEGEAAPQKTTQTGVKQALRPGNVYNDYGDQVPQNLYNWSQKGSNYASSYYENGKYGMKTKDGTILIKAEYDQIDYGFSGFMIAKKNSKTGVINEANEIVIPFEYENIQLLYVNHPAQKPKGVNLEDLRLLATKADNRTGIINGKGQIKFPFRECRLSEIVYFYDAPRHENGVILQNLPMNYAEILQKTAILFRGSENEGIVNGNGDVLLPFEYRNIENLNIATKPYLVVFAKDEKFGLIDLKSKVLIEPKIYTSLGLLNNISQITNRDLPTLLVATKANDTVEYQTNAGIIDSLGNTVLPFEYQGFGMAFKEGEKLYFAAQNNSKWGIVSQDNKVIVPFSYNEFIDKYTLSGKPFFAVKDASNKFYGLISLENKIILPFKYTYFHKGNGQLLIYSNENRQFGLVNANGKVVFEAAPQHGIAVTNNGYFDVYQDNGLHGLLNPEGKMLAEIKYRGIITGEDMVSYYGNAVLSMPNVVAVLNAEEGYYYLNKDGSRVKME
jgi:hypothetical protein